LAELELAVDKTEVMLFTKRRKFRPPVFTLQGKKIGLSATFKYLGLWFDKTLSFREHFRRVAEKANKKVAIMSRLMSNLGGPREAVRQLYLNVTLSMLLYGAPVWASTVQKKGDGADTEKGCAEECFCLSHCVNRGGMPISENATYRPAC